MRTTLAGMIIEGTSRAVQRPEPDGDVTVAAFTCHADGEVERLIRVVGLDRTDYLTSAEALALAGALIAASDELAPPGSHPRWIVSDVARKPAREALGRGNQQADEARPVTVSTRSARRQDRTRSVLSGS